MRVNIGDPLTKAKLWLKATPNIAAMTLAKRINRDFVARCSLHLEDMILIYNAELMRAIQQKDELVAKIFDMRVQFTTYESKAHYTNEAKREAMTFC